MEIIIEPPITVLFILIGVVVVIIASMLLKKGDRRNKLVSLVVTVVVVAGIIFVVYRKGAIIVNETGLRTKTFGRIELAWNDVREAELLEDFNSTGYGIKSKLSGIGIGELKAGLFLLKDGSRARVVVQGSPDALLLSTDDGRFLLAPNELPALLEEVEKYIPVR